MHLYNALTESYLPFRPLREEISIYVCGITPYDTTHLGHAFTYTSFDTLIRYLEFQGYSVRYVQNVTDIDDDILRKAGEEGEDWMALGNRWTRYFIEDLIKLNLRPPDAFPRATDVIPEIINAVEQLLEVGVAYEAAGNVYFHIDAWPDFGKLSHIPRPDMLPIANERGNSPDDPHKRAPLDFVLWQAQKPGEPAWDSPWGPGRPGWHIECSTMSSRFLGDTVDIHGGGGDLIFPHHECEIAQIEPVTNKAFVRFWLHVAMVYHEGEKMSKSLGNLVMVRDLLQTYSPDTLRLYLGSHHYRTSWNFDETDLNEAGRRADRLTKAVAAVSADGLPLDSSPAEAACLSALADDLDTPAALAVLDQLARDILAAANDGHNVHRAQATLRELGKIFGLRLGASGPEDHVIAGWNTHLSRFGPAP